MVGIKCFHNLIDNIKFLPNLERSRYVQTSRLRSGAAFGWPVFLLLLVGHWSFTNVPLDSVMSIL